MGTAWRRCTRCPPNPSNSVHIPPRYRSTSSYTSHVQRKAGPRPRLLPFPAGKRTGMCFLNVLRRRRSALDSSALYCTHRYCRHTRHSLRTGLLIPKMPYYTVPSCCGYTAPLAPLTLAPAATISCRARGHRGWPPVRRCSGDSCFHGMSVHPPRKNGCSQRSWRSVRTCE